MKKLILYISLFVLQSSLIFALSPPPDSLIIYKWNYNNLFNKDYNDFDSSLNYFQIYKPICTKNNTFSTIGNTGLSAIFNNYEDYSNTFYINSLNYLKNYLFTSGNNYYFNTRRHFSNVKYISGSKKENLLSILHTQNINPNFNAGFRYNLIASPGEYKRQSVRSNSFNFFTSYSSIRYNVNANYNYNKFKLLENGGIANDSAYRILGQNTSYLDVNLTNASSVIKYSDVDITQEIKIGKINIITYNDTISKDSIVTRSRKDLDSKLNLFHNFNYSSSYRIYDDKNPLSGFYNRRYVDTLINDTLYKIILDSIPIYISDSITYDSIFSKTISNSIYLKYQISDIIALFSFRNELYKYSIHTININDFSNFASFNILKRYNANYSTLKVEYGINGNDKGSVLIHSNNNFKVSNNSFLNIDFSFNRFNSDFFIEKYFSNHFYWDTSYLNIDETRYSISLYNQKNKFNITLGGLVLDNFIYFNEIGYPKQTQNTFNIYYINLIKEFNYRKLHYRIIGTYQINENKNVIKAPDYIIRNSLFFNFNLFKKVLKINTGIDATYIPKYTPYSYMPATGVFYNGYNNSIGNYHFIDIYVSASLKRALFFIKYENLLNSVLSYKYYSLNKYPVNSAGLKIGLSWNFYD